MHRFAIDTPATYIDGYRENIVRYFQKGLDGRVRVDSLPPPGGPSRQGLSTWPTEAWTSCRPDL